MCTFAYHWIPEPGMHGTPEQIGLVISRALISTFCFLFLQRKKFFFKADGTLSCADSKFEY